MNQPNNSLKGEKLERTAAEQAIIRNISALESELSEASDPERISELESQLNHFRGELAKLQGPDYIQLLHENERLKLRVKDLEKIISSVQGSCAPGKKLPVMVSEHEKSDREIILQHRLYKLLLEKYSEAINGVENKTVGEIKALINGSDLSIQYLLDDMTPQNYDFEKNYFEAAKKAFEFVSNEIDYVDANLKINFWLTPKEILSHKVGDDEDLAVFLCSLLSGLGDEKAEVVIAELENLTTHAVVTTAYHDKFLLMDPAQKNSFEKFQGERSYVLMEYSFNGSRIKRFIYKFNKNDYEQFI